MDFSSIAVTTDVLVSIDAGLIALAVVMIAPGVARWAIYKITSFWDDYNGYGEGD
ncbi:hypothetical protein [Collimonas fungivorans]|uniref:hypothetical protein n=1 Tax=Collimonas fungivorans TaxID=158899 RepID=UPI003FA364B6